MVTLSLRDDLLTNILDIAVAAHRDGRWEIDSDYWADKILEDLGVKIKTVETVEKRVL